MANLRIHQSNRLERLADLLVRICRPPLSSPLAAERIVVPNPGMARWLSLEFADRLGICANVDFPLPASFAWEIWRAVLDDVPDEANFSAPVLAWRLFTLLREIEGEPVFRPLETYLDGADDRRRFELAEHLASVFDQYLVYRPDMILSWEEGRVAHPPESRDEKWQAELWRRLVKEGRPRHRARLAREFERVSTSRLAASPLPERVEIFGVPALAPVHLRTLARVAEVADVHLLIVNPCRAYWLDILPPAEIARRSGEVDPAELYLESGNPLLASMGRQGRDFVAQLVDWLDSGVESFEAPGTDTDPPRLLDVLHADILDLRTRGSVDLPAATVSAEDRSVQIHVCHSAMREVEVLHDQLLELFRANPDLEPSQVRVMTPDIETYAPLIEAVFGTASGNRRIPYAIADRQPRAERSTVAAFLSLLELPESRFDAARLLALLETGPVRRRFDLDEGDLPRLADWVRTAGIRWGIDAAHRASLELPELGENTWRFGLDRLMLGHAMAGHGQRLFDGILPCDDVEGADVPLVARLDRFASEVFDVADALGESREPADWQAYLVGLLSRFFAGPEAEEDVETIRGAVRRLVEESRRAGCREELSLALVRRGLDRLLRQPGGAWAFLSGAVTFCTLVPMRNIPAQVVCLLGMNDGAYPRSRRPPGFDLIPRHPTEGDRSRRDDDRYLFLEALLSARSTFYVSYVGRSIRDNGEMPPSLLVSELSDVVEASAQGPDGHPPQVRTIHPLQGFSPSYFSSGSSLVSYAEEMCSAAEAALTAHESRPSATPAFLGAGLPEPDDEWRAVRLDQLLRFYRNPARFFLRDRLGVLLDETESLIEENEPFDLQRLERFRVRESMMQLALAEWDSRKIADLLRASGSLPHGLVGEHALDDIHGRVERVANRLRPLLPPEPLLVESIDTGLGDMRLTGSLSGLTRGGLVEYGFGSPNGRDQLALWIRHLVLNVLAPRGVEPRSRRVGDEGVLEFAPTPDAAAHLEHLLRLYWQGLSRPLRLFPDLSIDCARGKREDVRAEEIESQRNTYPAVAFRGQDPGGDEFKKLATDVFGPLLEAVVHS